MPFIFHCPYCQAPMTVPDGRAGTAAACPSCHQSLMLPVPPAEAPPPSPAPPHQDQPQTTLPSPPPQPVPQSVPLEPAPADATPQEDVTPVVRAKSRRGLAVAIIIVALLVVAGLAAGGFYVVRSGVLGKLTGKGDGGLEAVPTAADVAADTGLAEGPAGPVGTRYDGEWTLTTERLSPAMVVTFDVKNGSVTSLMLLVFDSESPEPGEKGDIIFVSFPPEEVPIADDRTFTYSGSVGYPTSVSLTFEGTFTSDTEAQGTYTSGDADVAWTAEKKGGEESSESAGQPVGTKYDGDWKAVADGWTITFTVADGELGLSAKRDPDSVMGWLQRPIAADGTFDCPAELSPGFVLRGSIEGAFTSGTEAKGTLTFDGVEIPWTARKQ